MLTAVTLLVIVSLILTSILNTVSQIWIRGESQAQYRWRARSMLNVMGAELKSATLSVDSTRDSLQFVINPPGAADFANHDSVFWQAPIATDTSGGNLAEVGYFVRWNDTEPGLCRFFLNPKDTDYRIYSNPNQWVTKDLLNSLAPASKFTLFRGLFLDKVLGFWVRAYNRDGTPYAGDSRATSPANRLPAVVECSLVVFGANTSRLAHAASDIKKLATDTDSAVQFIELLPDDVKKESSAVTIKVALKNAK